MKNRGCGTAIFALALCTIGAVVAVAQGTVLYNFKPTEGGTNGLVFDAQGNLYGTSTNGGYGYGSIFELSPAGDGTWTENDIFYFGFGFETEPALPVGLLAVDAEGNLYGTSEVLAGGGFGAVYEFSPPTNLSDPYAPHNWTLTVLYDFEGPPTDGANPYSGLTFDPKGNLYGTTNFGGANSGVGETGTVFELSPAAGGSWTEKILYNFGPTGEIAGGQPVAGLIFDSHGNLYGTTSSFGANGSGSVYELSPIADGGWTEKTLYDFPAIDTNPSYIPVANLAIDTKGILYGVNPNGGAHNFGSVFELSPAGDGSWTEKTLYSFGASRVDAQRSDSILVLDAKGNLYGTSGGGAYAGGAVFELTPDADGTWTEKIVHSFGGTSADGAGPSGLVMDAKGNLYGTTGSGGTYGHGTFFEISTQPATLTVAASDASIIYGDSVPEFTYSLTGFVNGDTAATATTGAPNVSTTTIPVPPVGYYPIDISPGTLSAPNYKLSFEHGYLAVYKATLHVNALRATKVYGAPIPPLNYTITGFVNGDTAASTVTGVPTIYTTATADSPVGSYPVDLYPGTLAAANYKFAGAGSGIDITKAPLTIAANSLTMVQGAAVPPLTYTMTGFVNGDTRATRTSGQPRLITTATSHSTPGNYPISIEWGSLRVNDYVVTFMNGTLHVTPQ